MRSGTVDVEVESMKVREERLRRASRSMAGQIEGVKGCAKYA